MRTMRSSLALIAGALGATLMGAPALDAQQSLPPSVQPPLYTATLDFGTGLIDIPVAWISPNNGDMWIQSSGKRIPACEDPCGLDFAERWNTNFSIDTHWMQRFSIGLSLYSQNPEWGFFGQALLLREREGSALPALAVGFRNLGSYDHEDRLLLGHDVSLGTSGGAHGITPGYARKFHTAPTIYGVATKSVTTSNGGVASLSVGYGSGIFHDDGELGDIYNDKGTIARGLFLGGRYAFHPSTTTTVHVLAENNGWDWNAGLVGEWRGITLGVYGTELEEGGKDASTGPLFQTYNYAKFNVTLGYSGNLYDIAHGVVLRSRVGELQQEQYQLRAEIASRQRRIDALQLSLQKAQAGELAEVARRRQALDAQIQEERDAIRRAQDRLKQLQSGQPANPTPPPADTTTPPPDGGAAKPPR